MLLSCNNQAIDKCTLTDVSFSCAFFLQETLVARIMKRASESATVRADDNEETLKTRIATFRENTEKILVQYPTQLRRVSIFDGL